MELDINHYRRIADCFPLQRGNVSMSNLAILDAILYVAERGVVPDCICSSIFTLIKN